MQQYLIDKKDVQIIRVLAKDCRLSYRNMALTLGVTNNTVKLRLQRLIANNIIEKFIVNTSFALFDDDLIWCILIMRCKSPEDINQQLSLLGNLFSHVECMGGVSVIHLTIKKEKEKGMRLFAKALKNAQLRNIFIIKLVAPQIISFNQTDLKIIKCLVLEPGMKILNVAKAISLSEKTVRKRLDRMAIHHILDFTLTLNPSAIRGYVFFGMIIRVESYRSQSIIEYIYSKFEEFLLRPPPPIINHGVIILVLYTSNFCVIEQILKKVESLEGVKEIEVFHAIRIRNSQEQLIREIDKNLAGEITLTTNIIRKT